jgi:lysophospholipase L1-like esterase
LTAKLITLLVSIVLCLLLMEGAARMLHGTNLRKPRIAHFEDVTQEWCCAGVAQDGRHTYKPNIAFKHCYDGRDAGNLESDDCITLRTNSWGYRDVEHERSKAPDSYRIVILGDSFSVGEGTRFDEIYARRLAASLESVPLQGKRAEVINLAMPGDDTFIAVRTYGETAASLDPDHVILQWSTNDFTVPKIVADHQALIGIRYRQMFDESARYSWSALVHFTWYALRMRELAESVYRPIQSELEEGRRDLAQLGSLRDEVEKTGAAFSVLIFPELILFDDYPYKGVINTVASYCREQELACVNLLPELAKYRAEELWAHETDHHPNQIAHAIASEALVQHLQQSDDRRSPR